MRRSLALILCWFSVQAMAADQPPVSVPNCAPDGVAVGGYDLISYRSASGPVSGDSKHSVELEGLRYLFATPANRDRFQKDPQKYLPVYQGWCAATLSFGKLACPEYLNYKIENGDLLLFEHTVFTNGRTVWNTDPLTHRSRADRNFTELLP